eukprot:TRINITY_DN46713_c0_g1_i1.p1 TRINITY_DN46713_c0_g1~~TRINITY_DN46713_c0_g1_i1.p1  ORF type:complete len:504 (+),score=96.43 TRINITY_DN46713_c0_g1_i1:135-1646(+)
MIIGAAALVLVCCACPLVGGISDRAHHTEARLIRKAPPNVAEIKKEVADLSGQVDKLAGMLSGLGSGQACSDDDEKAKTYAATIGIVIEGCGDISNECSNAEHGPKAREFCPVTCSSCEEVAEKNAAKVDACRDLNDKAVDAAAKMGREIDSCLDLLGDCTNAEHGEDVRTLCPKTCGTCTPGAGESEAAGGNQSYEASPVAIMKNPQDPCQDDNEAAIAEAKKFEKKVDGCKDLKEACKDEEGERFRKLCPKTCGLCPKAKNVSAANAGNTTGNMSSENESSVEAMSAAVKEGAANPAVALIGYFIFVLIAAAIYNKSRLKKAWPQKQSPENTVNDPYVFGYGVFSCFSDINICLCSFCCTPVRWADTMSKTEPPLVPFWKGVIIGGLLYILAPVVQLFLACFYVGKRQQLRELLGVKRGGTTVVDDYCGYVWCAPCLVAQEARQVEHMRQTVWKKEEEEAPPAEGEHAPEGEGEQPPEGEAPPEGETAPAPEEMQSGGKGA